MDDNYKELKKSSSRKKPSETHWTNYSSFLEQQRNLLDILGTKDQQKTQGDLFGAKMTKEDEEFHAKQKLVPRVGSCTSFVDRRWIISNKRKIARSNRSRKESYDDGFAGCSYNEDQVGPVEPADVVPADNQDEEYVPPKRQKYDYQEELNEDLDRLPPKFRHPRDGLRSIRPELYALMHFLSSSLHMSHEQVEGSIVAVANMLFARKWKVYSSDEYGTDNNTLPSVSNTRRTERYIEVMALCNIADEIMQEDSKICVVYSNDDSSQCNR